MIIRVRIIVIIIATKIEIVCPVKQGGEKLGRST